ncbi:unnamed protein product [Adineta ricciae]|uniref:Uncharacterized protein n=1 Tax=Adineta ricciae TaxID=249248 RepID=A0A814IFW7_ADIRI|nr:unnamed protein product [Adineta ricciae]CAF1021146.1 unnamed protein product [Adineta ricciae]
MNSNGTSGPIPILHQDANPLLYTLPQEHMNIQPYWIMIVEIVILQLIQRLWNLVRYHVFNSTLEIALLRWVLYYQIHLYEYLITHRSEIVNIVPRTLQPTTHAWISSPNHYEHYIIAYYAHDYLVDKLSFDIFDFIFYFLPICGHCVWYSYIQTFCMSVDRATHWNCYNAFGYRIFNYVFVSYVNFVCVFVMKTIALRDERIYQQKITCLDRINFHLGFWSALITFLFAGGLILPYLITHIIPMFFAYLFMTIVYMTIWFAALFFIVFVLMHIPVVKKIFYVPMIRPEKLQKVAVAVIIFAWSTYTYPILLSTLYNYTQYLYYGENFIYTMSNEFNARDTDTYISIFWNSVNLKLHSILDAI